MLRLISLSGSLGIFQAGAVAKSLPSGSVLTDGEDGCGSRSHVLFLDQSSLKVSIDGVLPRTVAELPCV